MLALFPTYVVMLEDDVQSVCRGNTLTWVKVVAYAKVGIVTGDGNFRARVCDLEAKKVGIFEW